MIEKELAKVGEIERYISSLTLDEVEKNLLKEDFFTYDSMHKEGLVLFERQLRPQERIFNLIQDCDVGSFEELEQIQNRLMFMMKTEWNCNKVDALKNRYLSDRHKIIESRLTIRQLFGDEQKINEIKGAVNAYRDSTNRETGDIQVWQLLDYLFNTIQNVIKEESNVPVEQKVSQSLKSKEQNAERLNQITEMFRRLLVIVKAKNDKEINNQIEINENANKKRKK